MFATVGIALLLVVRGLRPQEVVVALQPLPLVPLVFALALFGLVVDLKLRKSQLIAAPQLGWAIAFVACALVALAVARPPGARIEAAELVAGFATFFLLAQGVQRFRALALVAAILLALALVSAVVAMRPPSTLAAALGDPDARALTPALAVPLAFAFFERKRSATRGFLSIADVTRGWTLRHLDAKSRGSARARRRARRLLRAAPRPARPPRRRRARRAAVLRPRSRRPRAPRRARRPGRPRRRARRLVPVVQDRGGRPRALSQRRRRRRRLLPGPARCSPPSPGWPSGCFFVPPGHGTSFWIYTGLAGALYQAARAHDPKLTRPVVLIRF